MNLFTLLLIFHIAAGGISLLTGSIVMLLKKGDKAHRTIGKIYFYSLLLASIVSFPMAYLHPNWFLFIIGVFTSYMLLTGNRYIQRKNIEQVSIYDWILAITMLIFGLGFVTTGISQIYHGTYFGIVLLVFGLISIAFVAQDWQNFKGNSAIKNFGLTTHLQRMIGSYIASATAFLVVNNTILPGVIAWLLPTVILTPLIFWWTKRYMIL